MLTQAHTNSHSSVVPETKQLTLEEIDVVFGTVSAETRAKDVENALEVEKMKAHVDHDEGVSGVQENITKS